MRLWSSIKENEEHKRQRNQAQKVDSATACPNGSVASWLLGLPVFRQQHLCKKINKHTDETTNLPQNQNGKKRVKGFCVCMCVSAIRSFCGVRIVNRSAGFIVFDFVVCEEFSPTFAAFVRLLWPCVCVCVCVKARSADVYLALAFDLSVPALRVFLLLFFLFHVLIALQAFLFCFCFVCEFIRNPGIKTKKHNIWAITTTKCENQKRGLKTR